MNRTRLLRGVASVLVVTALVGACSDDDSEGSESGSGDTPAASDFTGEPVKVGVILPTETAGANFPEVLGAVEASALAINERGGIGDHMVEVVYCNEAGDTNQASECAQQMVDEGVIATVSTFSTSGGDGIYDILEPAGIAQVGPVAISASDFSNPVAFPTNAALLSFIGCGALFPEGAEIDSLGAIQFDVDSSNETIQLAQLGASSAGVTFTTSVRVPPTVTDLAPAVGEVADSGASGVVLSLPEQQSVQVLQTVAQLGEELSFCHSDVAISSESLGELGEAAQGYYAIGSFPPLSERDDIPEMQRTFDEIAAGNEAGIDSTDEDLIKTSSLSGWLNMQVVEQVGNAVTGELNAETFLATLKETQVTVEGLMDIDFSQESNIPNPDGDPLTHVFNGTMVLSHWDPEAGALVPVEGVEPIDGLQVLEEILGG